MHVRELLADLQLLSGDPRAARPMFDERALVHAPEARVFHAGRWQDGTLPTRGIDAEDRAQQERFFREIDSLKRVTGADGRRAFTIPVAQASTDPRWRALDAMTFAAWLDRERYTSRVLRWYLDYVCQDDYGAGADRVSAWAGLHYFASRGGHARNAEDGAVLTWPDGLHSLAQRMRTAITARMGNDGWQRPGFAARVQTHARDVEVLALSRTDSGLASFTIRAQRAICAMPLLVAARVVDRMDALGFDARSHLPVYAPWLVSNFLMRRFPTERDGVPLAWDNVVFEGRGLGYVVSTHQDIRLARPPHTVFSAYRALADRSPDDARRWLAAASPEALYDEAACDLSRVYGWRFALHAQALDVTVRGHAMASPLPGFLANAGTRALREADGRLLFAHADLSGYSVFEEAAWWGEQAARKVLA